MSAVLQTTTTLDTGLSQLPDINISAGARDQLLQYVALLMKWNRVYNLTAVRDPAVIVQRHLLDSLVLLRWLPEHSVESDKRLVSSNRVDVVDIGSGAGLPVLPLAIARPDLHFASVESNGKKTRFQHQVLVELQLKNVQVHHGRVQDATLQAAFVTSRAFTAPAQFLQLAQPLCTANAQVAVMLGRADKLPDPLPEAYLLEQLVPIDIPGAQATRHVALCRYRTQPLVLG